MFDGEIDETGKQTVLTFLDKSWNFWPVFCFGVELSNNCQRIPSKTTLFKLRSWANSTTQVKANASTVKANETWRWSCVQAPNTWPYAPPVRSIEVCLYEKLNCKVPRLCTWTHCSPNSPIEGSQILEIRMNKGNDIQRSVGNPIMVPTIPRHPDGQNHRKYQLYQVLRISCKQETELTNKICIVVWHKPSDL